MAILTIDATSESDFGRSTKSRRRFRLSSVFDAVADNLSIVNVFNLQELAVDAGVICDDDDFDNAVFGGGLCRRWRLLQASLQPQTTLLNIDAAEGGEWLDRRDTGMVHASHSN
jgi:hypothetical protein